MQYGDDKIFFFDGGVLSIGGGGNPPKYFQRSMETSISAKSGGIPCEFIAQKINWGFFISKISLMLASIAGRSYCR